MKLIIGVFGWIALIAAGLYVDVYLLLVGGIKEIVTGAQAKPVSGDLIGWGIAHIAFSGLGITIAVLLGIGLTVLLANTPRKRQVVSVHRSDGRRSSSRR